MPPIDNVLMEEIKEALRQYVIENPEATLTECIILIMGFGLNQASAEETITIIGDQFEEVNPRRLDFDEIKEQTKNASEIPADEIDLTEI